MFGSLYYNFWIALIGFTIYFLARFQTDQAPLSVVLFSLLWAAIAFVLTFIIRGILGYIVYTPEPKIDENEEDELTQDVESQNQPVNQVEIPSEKQSEEIAQVVQTMLNQEDK